MSPTYWTLLVSLIAIGFVALKTRWKLAVALLAVGPFAATGLLLAGGLALYGRPAQLQVSAFPVAALFFYLLFFPYALYPHGIFLAAILVLAYGGVSRVSTEPDHRGARLWKATIFGGVIGALFAAIVLAIAFLSGEGAGFVDFVSGGSRTSVDLSEELFICVFTGAVDGAAIGLFGLRSGAGQMQSNK